MKPSKDLLQRFQTATPDELAQLCVEYDITPIYIRGDIDFCDVKEQGWYDIQYDEQANRNRPQVGEQIGIRLDVDDSAFMGKIHSIQPICHNRLNTIDVYATMTIGDKEVILGGDVYYGGLRMFTQENFMKQYYNLHHQTKQVPTEDKMRLAEMLVASNKDVFFLDRDSLLEVKDGRLDYTFKYKGEYCQPKINAFAAYMSQYTGDEQIKTESQYRNLKDIKVYNAIQIGYDVALDIGPAIFTTVDCSKEMKAVQQRNLEIEQKDKNALAQQYATQDRGMTLIHSECDFERNGQPINAKDLKPGDNISITYAAIGAMQAFDGSVQEDRMCSLHGRETKDGVVRSVWTDGKDFVLELDTGNPGTFRGHSVLSTVNFGKEYNLEKARLAELDAPHKEMRSKMARKCVRDGLNALFIDQDTVKLTDKDGNELDFHDIKRGDEIHVDCTQIGLMMNPESELDIQLSADATISAIVVDDDRFAVFCEDGTVYSTIDFKLECFEEERIYEREEFEEEYEYYKEIGC